MVCHCNFKKLKNNSPMEHSLSKVKQVIQIDSLNEFGQLLSAIPSVFYHQQFQKSKSEYIGNMHRLFHQIDDDFHFVWVLKQEKYAFQLRWKESVLKAHLDLLVPQIPNHLRRKKAV
jgi:hypothetical protein